MFGSSTQAPPLPQLPPPPPNPPMFGQNAPKKSGGSQGTNTAFNATVLGTLPTNTAQKTLLGS